jgi:tyrosine-protein phosphatase SIW14
MAENYKSTSVAVGRLGKRLLFLWLFIALAATGGLLWHHYGVPYHFRTVVPGALYRSGSLAPGDLKKVVGRFGIKTIVSLRLQDEQSPRPNWYAEETEFCRRAGIKFVHIPMKGKAPPTESQREEWLGVLDHHENYPVLVHCAQGVARTGMMVAIYEMEYQGKDNATALGELTVFGHDLKKASYQPMRDYILHYQPRLKIAKNSLREEQKASVTR